MKTLTGTNRIVLFLVFCFFSTIVLHSQASKNNGDDAVISSQKVPTDMDKEHIYTLTYTVKNTGTTTWKAADYKLKVYVSAAIFTDNSRWLVPNVSIPGDVLPGMETTVTTQVTAWNDNGDYSFTAQMSRNDAPFGKVSDPVIVNVH